MLADVGLALFVIPVVVIALMSRSRGRHWSGVRLLTLAPLFMPLGEDGLLAFWYAIATPTVDPHAARTVVPDHTAGHMLGAGVAAIVLGIVTSYIAWRHLGRGAAWAWNVLLWIGVPVVTVGLVELVWFFGHGLPTLAEADGGFGWPFWVAGILAWTVGLVMARPPHPIAQPTRHHTPETP